MDLAHQNQLWLLLLLPCLVVWAARSARLRVRQWSALGQTGPLHGDGTAGWIAAIVCLIVALAQPRWGRVASPPLPPGHDLVLLVDDSLSMAAQDAVPDRLGMAVEAASSLLKALARAPGNRAAVVAFAGRGVLRCPFTEDLAAAGDVLRTLRPGDVRPGGTDLGAGLTAARDAFGGRAHDPERAGGRAVVVFSDGEDHAGSWQPVLAQLRAAGVVVHTVAVGDAEHGHPVPKGRGEAALTYQGAQVLSRRSDPALAGIAEATGGAFVPLGLSATDIGELYVNHIEPVARQKRTVFRGTDRTERYGWFVLAALGLGLAGSWPGRAARAPRLWPIFGRAGLLALLVLAAGAGGGTGKTPDTMTAARVVESGRAAYGAGRWTEALAAFERACALDPEAAVPHYDVAATLFQMGRYADAAEAYAVARQRAGPALRTKIDYALGNTALALGEVTGAIARYDACITSTATGSDLDAVRRDAALNRRFAVATARRAPSAPGSDEGSEPSRRSRTPGSESREPEQQQRGGQGPEPGPGNEAPAAQGPGRRGPGGAGGSGAAPPEAGSPDERLDQAVERVREARRHRLPEPPPQEPRGDRLKEW